MAIAARLAARWRARQTAQRGVEANGDVRVPGQASEGACSCDRRLGFEVGAVAHALIWAAQVPRKPVERYRRDSQPPAGLPTPIAACGSPASDGKVSIEPR